jgi:hypothetical protein
MLGSSAASSGETLSSGEACLATFFGRGVETRRTRGASPAVGSGLFSEEDAVSSVMWLRRKKPARVAGVENNQARVCLKSPSPAPHSRIEQVALMKLKSTSLSAWTCETQTITETISNSESKMNCEVRHAGFFSPCCQGLWRFGKRTPPGLDRSNGSLSGLAADSLAALFPAMEWASPDVVRK